MGLFAKKSKKKDAYKFSDTTVKIDCNIKLSPGESLSRSKSSEKKPKLSPDEQWQRISTQIQQHLQEGKLGLYACDMYALSEIDRKEKRYNDQMKKLIISAYIHLSGAEEFKNYQLVGAKAKMVCPILPPAVIGATRVSMKRLNMDISAYQELFRQTIEKNMTPLHLYGIEGTLEIICLYLNDEPAKAEKKIESGAKKYISTHCNRS